MLVGTPWQAGKDDEAASARQRPATCTSQTDYMGQSPYSRELTAG